MKDSNEGSLSIHWSMKFRITQQRISISKNNIN